MRGDELGTVCGVSFRAIGLLVVLTACETPADTNATTDAGTDAAAPFCAPTCVAIGPGEYRVSCAGTGCEGAYAECDPGGASQDAGAGAIFLGVPSCPGSGDARTPACGTDALGDPAYDDPHTLRCVR